MKKMRVALALVVSAFMTCFTQAQVAKVGNTEYETIDKAIANWTNNTTLTLLADVTLSDVIKLSSTEYHILDLGTYTMTAAKNKNAIEYVINGRTSASYALDIKADATNPGGITATGKSIVVHTKPTSGAPSKDRPITRFYGGVFNASTIVKQNGGFLGLGAGYTGSNAPYFWFYGGEFNGAISTNRSQNQFHGGTFNDKLYLSVDSSSYTLVAGGKFKYLSNLQGSDLDEKIAQGVDNYKFTIGSAKATYDRGIYVDKDGYYVITSAPITEVSAKYPAVYKTTYGGDDYFYYSAAQANGLFYEDADMAIAKHGKDNVTVFKLPEGLEDNKAVEDFEVQLPNEVKELKVELSNVEGETKVVYNVEPKNEAGEKVSEPGSAITFRLALPSSWTGFAKVFHAGADMGLFQIMSEGEAKYVEISSASFSEFAIELATETVVDDAFGANTVFDGTNYYATLQAAVEEVCGTDGATLYCKPGADVGSLQHAPVTATLTIYGNGAYVSGGAERDFDIGNTDPNGPGAGKVITADMTLTVKDLEGCGAWGNKATAHTVNLVFEDCQNMGKVYISGTTGTLNITIKDSAFEGVLSEAVYANANGAITLTNVDFSNLTKAINLNHKAAGTQTVTLTNCEFTNCGADVAADQIPVRVLSSVDGGKSTLTVSGCTFSGTPEGGADILLDYGIGETTASVTTTTANVKVETEENVGTTTNVTSSTETKEFTNVLPAAKIGDTPYATLSAAFAAVTDDNQTVTILKDVTENLTGAYLRGNIVTENGATVTITLTNGDWVYCPYTFVLGANVTLKCPAFFYYAGGAIIKGTLITDAYYQRYADTKLYIEGTMTVNSETFILRYTDGDANAGIYVNGGTLNASVIYFYQGMISATNGTINIGTYWQTNGTDGQGSANLVLDNSTLTVSVYDHPAKATGNSTVTLKNGSTMNCQNGGFTYDETALLAVDSTCSIIGKGGEVVKIPVAKIGGNGYTSLEDAFNAAAEGDTIVMLADATPALTSQRAITKAAVIDLGGKTLTLTEDDLYFGTTSFKNGTIVVDPSVKPSTAVFWMFANQTLTFDNVKVVATGVTGTYLIGLDGNNSDLNLLNGSEIFVDNTTELDLDIICVNASTGNDIVIDNSKINVKNLDGRVLFRGNYTIKGTSELKLEGITKAGIRIEAGQTLSIEDTASVTITGDLRDGGIHLTDLTATYTKADTATVNATLNRPNVATVNGVGYATLAEAFAAAKAGDEIVLLANISDSVTTPAGIIFNGNGKQIAGTLYLMGDVTLKGHVKANAFDFENVGTEINIPAGATFEITGTGRMIIGHGCTFNIEGTIADAKTADKTTLTPSLIMPGASFTGAGVTFNVKNAYISAPSSYCSSSKSASGTFDFNIENSIIETAGKLAFEAQSTAATVNFELKNSVLNTGSHLVFGVAAGEVVIDNSNVNVGTSRQLENRSTMTIKNGSVVNGAVATSSNAINSGTIIVENATYAVTGQFSGSTVGTGTLIIKQGANVSVGSIVDKANIQIDATGMTADEVINFTANLSKFTGTVEVINNDKLEAKIVDGKIVLAKKPVAKIGEDGYATLEDAFKAATEACTIEILSDVTIDYKWDCRDYATGGSHSQFKETVTINGNGHTLKFTGTISDGNWNTIFRFEENATVKNLTVDISGATGAQRVISAKKSLTVDGLTIVGSAKYGIIFGEGASATDFAAAEIVVKNSTLTGTRRAISDNEGGKDVKSVVITGNTLKANVYASASESITFNNNTANGEVDLRSYTAETVLSVEAKGNTLTAGVKNYIYAKDINAQADFTTKRPPFKVTTKDELDVAVAAVQDGDVIEFLADITTDAVIVIDDDITINGNDKTITSSANRVIRIAADVTINNLNMVSTAKVVYPNDIRGVSVDSYTANDDFDLVLNNCSVDFTDATAIDWAYAVNQSGNSSTGNSITIIGGTYEGANVININGTGHTVTIDGATLTSIYGYNAQYYGLCVSFNDGANTAEIKNTTFNGDHAKAIKYMGSTVVEENNTNNTKIYVAQVGSVYYHSFAEAFAAAKAGDKITLLRDVTASEIIVINKSITIDGNGKTLTYTGNGESARAIDVPNNADAKVNVTIKNLTVDCTASYCQRGINYNDDGVLTLEAVTVKGKNVTYALNLPGSSDNATVDIKGSALTGNIALNVWGENVTITAKNTAFTSVDTVAHENYSAIALNNDGTTIANGTIVTITDGSITALNENGEPSNAIRNGTETGSVNVSDTTVVKGNYTKPVAIVDYGTDQFYNCVTLQQAINKAIETKGSVKLLTDTEVSEIITVDGAVVIDLNDKTITGTAKKVFEVYANVTIKNGTIKGANRCVDTRTAVEFTLTDVTLIADKYTSYGNPQPLTIGGSTNGTKVTMNNVTINAGTSGYGIITFVKTELEATDSTISGYSALYVKPGSDNSKFTFVNSDLIGDIGSNDVEDNSFSAIAIRANAVAVTMDANSTLTATGNFYSALSLGGSYAGEETVANATVTIAGTIEGDIVSATTLDSNTIKVKAEYAGDLLAEGYCTGEADANGLVVIMGKTLAQIGDKYYATVEEALAAAQDGTKVTVMNREAAETFGEKLVATGGKKGAAAYDVATLLGGSFKKTAEGTLHYDYAFGVSNVAYADNDKFTVTVAIEDADSTVARTLTGRTLVLRMVVEGDESTPDVITEIKKVKPTFVAADGQVTFDVTDVVLPAAGMGKATYFTVKVID